MRKFEKFVSCTTLAALVLGGCASSSKEISAAYISPMTYDSYNCEQLSAEMQRISSRVQQVSGSVDSRASNDSVAMGVGLVLFWPALFFLKGDGPEAQELARLKGEYDAVNQTAIRKQCGIGAAPAAAAQPTTSPSAPASKQPEVMKPVPN